MTDSEWLAVWFFPNDIQPVAGHKFTIWSRPIERWDGEFKCEVLTVRGAQHAELSLVGRPEELKGFGKYMDTKVTWTLTPLAERGHALSASCTRASTQIRNWRRLVNVMAKGSESVLRSLAKRLPDLSEHGA